MKNSNDVDPGFLSNLMSNIDIEGPDPFPLEAAPAPLLGQEVVGPIMDGRPINRGSECSDKYLNKLRDDVKNLPNKKVNTLSKKIPHKPLTQAEIDKFNILKPDNLDRLMNKIIEDTSGSLSQIISTTMTITGRNKGVIINHVDMDPFDVNEHVIKVVSNFGEKTFEGYQEPQKTRQNRGRRKKPKVATKRKKQGSGKYMNSQITVVILYNERKYKIKLFNGDSFQIPGINNNDFLEVLRILENYLFYSYYLPPDRPAFKVDQPENDGAVKVMWVKAGTKNYKMYFKLLPRHVLNLCLLSDIFRCEVLKYKYDFEDLEKALAHECSIYNCSRCADLAHVKSMRAHKIPMACYYKCDNKLTKAEFDDNTGLKLKLMFYNGIVDKKDKFTTVNIFRGSVIDGKKYHSSVEHNIWGAKITILGGLHESQTKDIYNYLNMIFTFYYDAIQIFTDDIDNIYELSIYPDNVGGFPLKGKLTS